MAQLSRKFKDGTILTTNRVGVLVYRKPNGAERAADVPALLGHPEFSKARRRKKRETHVLTPITKIWFPERFVFLDSESYLKDSHGNLRVIRKPREDGKHQATFGHLDAGDRITFHEPRMVSAEYWVAAGKDYKQVDRIAIRRVVEEERLVRHRVKLTRAERRSRKQRFVLKEVVETHRRRVTEMVPVFPHKGLFVEDDYIDYVALQRAFWKALVRCAETACGKNAHQVLYVVGHNIEYDLMNLGAYERLAELGWVLNSLPYDKGPVYIATASKGAARIKLLSSTNWFHSSLHDLGEMLGIPKMELWNFNTKNKRLLGTYCRNDTVICRAAVLRLIRTFKKERLGPWRDTIASMSFAMFRHRFMAHEITVHINPEAIQLERQMFAGGRTEAWGLGTYHGRLYALDANNLYGFSMMNTMVPVRLLEVVHDCSVEMLLDRLHGGYGAIAEVDVSTERADIPKKKGKLLFPVGTYRTTLGGPELQHLLDTGGTILKAGRASFYEMAPVFHSAIEYLSAWRVRAQQKGLKAARQLAKDLSTNLYGKFGQKSDEWKCVGPFDPARPVGKMTYNFSFGTFLTCNLRIGLFVYSGRREESYNAFPAIAGYITSFARVHFARLKHIAGEHHAYYGDTDSLFVDEVGRANLERAGWLDNSALGKLKLEWDADELLVSGAKVYVAMVNHQGHEPHKHSKHSGCVVGENGVPSTEPHVYRHEVFKGVPLTRSDIVTTEDGQRVYEYEQFPKLASFIAKGAVGRMFTTILQKDMRVEYDKAAHERNIDMSKWTWLQPWRFPEDQALEDAIESNPEEDLGLPVAPPAEADLPRVVVARRVAP